ncbi:hypothetical protein C0Q70_13579 [Pomacea canaliculata]|uniref:Uncharacterized protein n=1 Tax=Pomacea canaliculata TaxID=400727 RepID=A0A2T7NXM1_POMCA|nr:hypothetical protein C0Q70_13579 [Pomacea canaliculata]
MHDISAFLHNDQGGGSADQRARAWSLGRHGVGRRAVTSFSRLNSWYIDFCTREAIARVKLLTVWSVYRRPAGNFHLAVDDGNAVAPSPPAPPPAPAPAPPPHHHHHHHHHHHTSATTQMIDLSPLLIFFCRKTVTKMVL